jgi:predicted RNA-binding Zn ribbon-like protein
MTDDPTADVHSAWPATRRYGLVPAPGALALVQDLVNTGSATGEPDLLADLVNARQWADSATAQWSAATGLPVPEVVLDADGLQELRAFRDDLHEVMTRAHDAAPGTRSVAPVHSAAAALQLAPDGSVRLQPQETGLQALVMLVLAALYEGQLAGTRVRLKTCRNPGCPLAFYDRSRNASGVWCSVRICGNAINLRAHRERRRVQGT